MKNFIVIIISVTFLSCQSYGQQASTTAIKNVELRDVSGYNSLKVSGLAVVYLTKGEKNKIKLEVSGMPIDNVITKVKNGVLDVTTRGHYNGESIAVYVSSLGLKSIIVGGSSELYGRDIIETSSLNVSVRDAGVARLNVNVSDLKIEMNGGDLNIRGNAKRCAIRYLKHGERGTLNQRQLTIESHN